MPVTTTEFEKHLEEFLDAISSWKRCGWCGDHRRNVGPRSRLCNICKAWERRERKALRKCASRPVDEMQLLYAEYEKEFARLCREEGQINSWQGPISALKLEWEMRSLTNRFLGDDIFGSTTPYFEQFSPAQRRLLMYMFERMTKIWLRNHRRGFAIEAVHARLFQRRRNRISGALKD